MERLRDLDESGLLARIFPLYAAPLPRPWGSVPVGPGDDAAVVGAPAGAVVATTDSMVRVRDWRDEWSSGHDVGVKVAAQNVADVAAMGAEPTGLLVSLVADPETAVAWADDLARGIAAVAREAGAPVVGGDLSSGPPGVVVVTVTALGDLRGRARCCAPGRGRGTSSPCAARWGAPVAGLALLLAGRVPEAGAGLVRHHLAPRPPWESGPVAADAGATALVDVSDGLVTDLGRVARASGVGVDLDGAVLRERFAAGPLDRALGSERGAAPGARRRRGALARRLLPGGHRPRGARRASRGSSSAGSSRRRPRTGPGSPSTASCPTPAGWDHFAAAERERRRPDTRNGRPPRGRPPVPGCVRRGSALDLAGLEAGGADVEPLRGHAGVADEGPDALDVRVPAALGAAVRVRDVVPESRALAADVAGGSHG